MPFSLAVSVGGNGMRDTRERPVDRLLETLNEHDDNIKSKSFLPHRPASHCVCVCSFSVWVHVYLFLCLSLSPGRGGVVGALDLHDARRRERAMACRVGWDLGTGMVGIFNWENWFLASKISTFK